MNVRRAEAIEVSVSIHELPREPFEPSPAWPDPSSALTRRVRAVADELVSRQQAGVISSRALAKSLNADGIPNPLGRRWSSKSVYRMLKHGKALGLPFIVRSPAEAAEQRIPNYASRSALRDANNTAWRRFRSREQAAENDTVIIARGSGRASEEVD
jgi:hypothetical protein